MSLKSTTHTTAPVEATDNNHQDDARDARGAESSGEIKGGGRWQVFITSEGPALVVTLGPGMRSKRRIAKTLSTPEDRAKFARMAAPDVKAKMLEDGKKKEPAASPPNPVKLTFQDVGDLWTSGDLTKRFPDHCPPKASVDADKSRLGILYKQVGHVPIAEFSIDDAERAMQNLPERCKTPATRKQYGQCLRRVVQLAVYPLRLRADNPIPKNFMPRANRSTAVQWLYPSEEAKLASCDQIPIERRLLWGVLAREGMRDGSEAIATTWDCIDLERGVLRLDKNKTKTPRSWRLDPSVVRALKKWKALRYPDLKPGEEPPPNAFVFVDENGSPWDGTRFAEVFREDLKTAGIKRPELYEKVPGVRNPIRAHDLRATFVTVKLAIGWTEAQISARTGHQSSQMIARYRRIARTAEELEVGDFQPLDVLLFGEEPKAPEPDPKSESTDVPGDVPAPEGAASRGNDVPSGSTPTRSQRAVEEERAPSETVAGPLNPLVSGSSPGWPTSYASEK